jgi:hypothetical protein
VITDDGPPVTAHAFVGHQVLHQAGLSSPAAPVRTTAIPTDPTDSTDPTDQTDKASLSPVQMLLLAQQPRAHSAQQSHTHSDALHGSRRHTDRQEHAFMERAFPDDHATAHYDDTPYHHEAAQHVDSAHQLRELDELQDMRSQVQETVRSQLRLRQQERSESSRERRAMDEVKQQPYGSNGDVHHKEERRRQIQREQRSNEINRSKVPNESNGTSAVNTLAASSFASTLSPADNLMAGTRMARSSTNSSSSNTHGHVDLGLGDLRYLVSGKGAADRHQGLAQNDRRLPQGLAQNDRRLSQAECSPEVPPPEHLLTLDNRRDSRRMPIPRADDETGLALATPTPSTTCEGGGRSFAPRGSGSTRATPARRQDELAPPATSPPHQHQHQQYHQHSQHSQHGQHHPHHQQYHQHQHNPQHESQLQYQFHSKQDSTRRSDPLREGVSLDIPVGRVRYEDRLEHATHDDGLTASTASYSNFNHGSGSGSRHGYGSNSNHYSQ